MSRQCLRLLVSEARQAASTLGQAIAGAGAAGGAPRALRAPDALHSAMRGLGAHGTGLATAGGPGSLRGGWRVGAAGGVPLHHSACGVGALPLPLQPRGLPPLAHAWHQPLQQQQHHQQQRWLGHQPPGRVGLLRPRPGERQQQQGRAAAFNPALPSPGGHDHSHQQQQQRAMSSQPPPWWQIWRSSSSSASGSSDDPNQQQQHARQLHQQGGRPPGAASAAAENGEWRVFVCGGP